MYVNWNIWNTTLAMIFLTLSSTLVFRCSYDPLTGDEGWSMNSGKHYCSADELRECRKKDLKDLGEKTWHPCFETLKVMGMDDNTIVIFLTDNGAEKFIWPDDGASSYHVEKEPPGKVAWGFLNWSSGEERSNREVLLWRAVFLFLYFSKCCFHRCQGGVEYPLGTLHWLQDSP